MCICDLVCYGWVKFENADGRGAPLPLNTRRKNRHCQPYPGGNQGQQLIVVPVPREPNIPTSAVVIIPSGRKTFGSFLLPRRCDAMRQYGTWTIARYWGCLIKSASNPYPKTVGTDSRIRPPFNFIRRARSALSVMARLAEFRDGT